MPALTRRDGATGKGFFSFGYARAFASLSVSRNGVPEGNRTPDPRFRKPVLYPAELPGRLGRRTQAADGVLTLPRLGGGDRGRRRG